MEAATTIVAVSNENKLGLVAKIKRDKRLADGATYRAKNKDKLLAYNRYEQDTLEPDEFDCFRN